MLIVSIVLQFAMLLRSSSATMATVFHVVLSAMAIAHVLMEVTNETVVSVIGLLIIFTSDVNFVVSNL